MFDYATHTGDASSIAVVSLLAAMLFLTCMTGCSGPEECAEGGTFGDDLKFLESHTDVIVLSDDTGDASIVVAPEYQGKVMTSTAAGDAGISFGWINRELIASGERMEHINPFGGEDRFWLGPEGGQFSVFFPESSEFVFDVWQTPEPIDWGAWEVAEETKSSVTLNRPAQIVNYSGFTFDIDITRVIRLLDKTAAESLLGTPIPSDVKYVAYQSDNRVTNTGTEGWTKDKGLLSIWILGMFNPSPTTTVVVPFKAADVPQDQIVNDAYFGKVPAERLVVKPAEGVLYFSGDGQCRSKIGVGPVYVLPVAGSYDSASQVLTLVQYTLPDQPAEYVNSMWELQDEPFAGDVVNSYNDGPLDDGGQLGPFYELETSSPALALEPGASATHVHRTFHLQGPAESLDPIAQKLLGVSIEEIAGALGD